MCVCVSESVGVCECVCPTQATSGPIAWFLQPVTIFFTKYSSKLILLQPKNIKKGQKEEEKRFEEEYFLKKEVCNYTLSLGLEIFEFFPLGPE